MTYYCKKCGAVVTGRYCSCCGKKATSDFQDFRNTQRRMDREFVNWAYETDKERFGNGLGLEASRVGSAILDLAFDRLLPSLNVDNFDARSKYCWDKLPECRELAELLFERVEKAVCR